MKEWCMEHPWMTFFIILAAIQGITYILCAVAKSFGGGK